MIESKDFCHGKAFPPAMRVFGAIILIAGIIALLENPLIGGIVILVGAIPAFSTVGFQWDMEKNNCREYTKYLGIRTGEWTPLDAYPDIAIRRSIQSSSAFSRALVQMETGRNTFYVICLLNESHRKRKIVNKLKDKEKALSQAHELAELWNKKFTVFNPRISAKSQARKRVSKNNR